ncbi:MAG: hypothetical protein MUE36_00355 [Acidimicrobiales bacterium]|jgi:hypothetical protein|nr:hypothetical protein [Acidimicrobiales bacterium]
MSFSTEIPAPLPRLHVEAWADPVVDELGVDPRGAYTERFWLPVLGPSTIWFLRRVADRLDVEPEGFELDLADVARCLGVGMRGGRNAPIMKTVERCCRFGAARLYGHTNLEVRRRLAPLNRAQTERLPDDLRAEHDAWVTRPQGHPTGTQLQERARRLALSLLELGEAPEACERQLHRWRFHPAIAFEAVRWAVTAHAALEDGRPTPPTASAPVAALATAPPSARLAAPGPGSPLPRPVPTVDPTPGPRSSRPPAPAIGDSRPSAAGGPGVLSAGRGPAEEA